MNVINGISDIWCWRPPMKTRWWWLIHDSWNAISVSTPGVLKSGYSENWTRVMDRTKLFDCERLDQLLDRSDCELECNIRYISLGSCHQGEEVTFFIWPSLRFPPVFGSTKNYSWAKVKYGIFCHKCLRVASPSLAISAFFLKHCQPCTEGNRDHQDHVQHDVWPELITQNQFVSWLLPFFIVNSIWHLVAAATFCHTHMPLWRK